MIVPAFPFHLFIPTIESPMFAKNLYASSHREWKREKVERSDSANIHYSIFSLKKSTSFYRPLRSRREER
jgi:hypothetical protein